MLLGAIALLAGCQNNQFRESPMVDLSAGFEVELESIVPDAGPDTKTLADDQHLVVWHNDDRVSVFEKKEYWEEYMYTGRTGTVGGRLKKMENGDSTTGDDLDYYYAVYPHSELNGFDNRGHMLLTIPREQPYEEFSFGRGTNVMVSVSETDSFKFKNVGGYLVFKLYGEGISVSSVRLVSKNGQKLTGDINVVASLGADPVATISTASYANTFEDAVVVCDPPVALGATKEDYKEFWFVLPPMTLNGYSIEVITSDGKVWMKSTDKAKEVKRNVYSPLSAMEIAAESLAPAGNIAFADPNIKAALVAAFDSDGDGELSYLEAANVTSIEGVFGSETNYTSFDEFQYFTGVTSVPENMFRGWSLTSIIIPGSVTSIEYGGLGNCSSLTSIVIPDSVTNIGEAAFLSCHSLTSITIPSSVTSIGVGVFSDCSSLTSIVIPDSVTILGGSVFDRCSSLVSVVIPDSVMSIGSAAFSRCSSLTSITIPNSVTSIGFYAFLSCSRLTSIVIPDSVTIIDSNAFWDCGSLTSIVVNSTTPPAGGSNMFSYTNDCPIYVPAESVDAYKSAQYWSDYADRIQAIQEINGHAYVDMGNGLKWATMNVGASSPEDHGDYFAWGETAMKEYYCWETYFDNPRGDGITFSKYATNKKTVLEPVDDAANQNWGGSWRVPTNEEWVVLRNKDFFDWNWDDTKKGYTVTSRIEGFEGNWIFLPANGVWDDSRLLDVGTRGYYWSSSIDVTTSSNYAYYSFFNSTAPAYGSCYRYYGLSIRPVSD